MPTRFTPLPAVPLPLAKHPTRFWFALSLLVCGLYGMMMLAEGMKNPYLVQDDARQHLFWMRRFLDPELFPQDWIANYFQSVAPAGYTAFYWILSRFQLDPVNISRFVAIALGLISSVYCYWLTLAMLPLPFAGFLSTLLLNQTLWAHDDLASATPRAFLYPLFLAFLYYFCRRSLFPCIITVALLGLFYPQYVLVASAVLLLSLVEWRERQIRLTRNRQDYLFVSTGLMVAFLVLLPFALNVSDYGPTISAAEARQLPEFSTEGRTKFFYENPWQFWLSANRSGLMPTLRTPVCLVGLLLPLLLRFPQSFPLTRQVLPAAISLLLRLAIAGIGLYGLAHLLLFKLHLPSRYSSHSLRIALAIASGITLTLLLDAAWRWLAQQPQAKQLVGLGVIAVISVLIVIYPNLDSDFPHAGFQEGEAPEVYEFLSQQPKDTLIASLTQEADFFPTFAQRSVLTSKEYSVPYHRGYYQEISQRTRDLIRAHYHPRLAVLREFIQTYGIDFFVTERGIFGPRYLSDRWLMQFQPEADAAIASLQERQKPALSRLSNRCTVFKGNGFNVIAADCILQTRDGDRG